MKTLVAAFALIAFSAPAFASGEMMVLYPKERASHQSDMDASADKYNARAKSFIDDLYASHAEGAPKTAAADKPKIPEADLDAYINGTAKLTGDTPSKKAPTSAPPLPSAAQ